MAIQEAGLALDSDFRSMGDNGSGCVDAAATALLNPLLLFLLLLLPLQLTFSCRCGGDLSCLETVVNATYNSLYSYLYTHQNTTTIAVFVYSAFLFPNASAPLSFPVTYNLLFNLTLGDSARSPLQAKLALDCAILRARGGTGASCSMSTRSYPSVPNRVSK